LLGEPARGLDLVQWHAKQARSARCFID